MTEQSGDMQIRHINHMTMEAWHAEYLSYCESRGVGESERCSSRTFRNTYDHHWKPILKMRETSQHARSWLKNIVCFLQNLGIWTETTSTYFPRTFNTHLLLKFHIYIIFKYHRHGIFQTWHDLDENNNNLPWGVPHVLSSPKELGRQSVRMNVLHCRKPNPNTLQMWSRIGPSWQGWGPCLKNLASQTHNNLCWWYH